jgi:hypothetical protein
MSEGKKISPAQAMALIRKHGVVDASGDWNHSIWNSGHIATMLLGNDQRLRFEIDRIYEGNQSYGEEVHVSWYLEGESKGAG